MKAEKFTDKDRKLVLEELERIQKAKLMPVKSSRKFYIDENGLPFLIFGGREDWHGLTANGMRELSNCIKGRCFCCCEKI